MEHRNGSRSPLSLEVELWQRGEKCGTYKTRDISYGGLFIEGCHRKLTDGDFVLTKITAAGTDKGISKKIELFPVKALTVHTSNHGAGLMWADYNESVYTLLDDLVHVSA